jgi:RNAse (barnase) inhibitor barstar
MAMIRGSSDAGRLYSDFLRDGPIVLYHRMAILAEDVQWLKGQGYQVDAFDCSGWQSVAEVCDVLAKGLAFPEWCGRNLDALNDCLAEIPIPDNSGRVLVFHRFDAFAGALPQPAADLLDIITANAWNFLISRRWLLALLQSDQPRISLRPVGARAVVWNRREWRERNRGS